MSGKIWKYVYKDEVKTESIEDPVLGTVDRKTAKHLPNEGDFVIIYDTEDITVCFIQSDIEIEGLELVSSDGLYKGVR